MFEERPWRRYRTASGSDQFQQQGTAPARPLVTPQGPQQQRWPRREAAEAAAGDHQTQQHIPDDDFPAAEAPSAAAASITRWMACSYKAGVLGVASYDRLSNELSVLQTSDESTGPAAFQMLQYIKLQVDPQVIFLSATAEPALIKACKLVAAAAAGAAAAGDGDSTGEPTVQLQRPSLFTYNKALQMMRAIQIRGQPAQQQQQQQAPSGRRGWGSQAAGPAAELIDTSAQQQVAALGALIAALLQLQEEEASADGTGCLLVDKLSDLQLEGHLIVDAASLAALDIFKEEEHPSAMGIGSSKEGVSVYGLLQRCMTGMGQRLLRQWFLRPVVQLDVISDRHDTLELLVDAHTTNDALRAGMRKVQDLPRLLARLRASQARPELSAFKQLHDSIRHLMNLQAAVAALAPTVAAAAAAAGDGSGMGIQAAAAAAAGGGGGVAVGGGGGVDFGSAYETPKGRQPGWLFDDADAAEEAAANQLFQQHPDSDAFFGSGRASRRAARSVPGLFGDQSTAAGPSSSIFTQAQGGVHGGGGGRGAAAGSTSAARGSSRGGGGWVAAAGAGAAGGGADGLPAGGPWDRLRITEKLLRCIGQELSSCCCMVGDVLDLSCSLEGCLVQPGVCAPLDELRDTLDQLPSILTQYIEQELARVPPHVARRNNKQLWSVVFIPQVGFVISVSGGKLSEELLELLPDYKLAFMGEDGPAGFAGAAAADAGNELDRGCAYYTCDGTQQLDAGYGDLQHKIQDLEASICTELIKRLLQYGPALTAASAAVAELDCLCSLAAAARELGYCRPQLVADSVIHIQGGRHPLCELLAPGTFIDNDTALGTLTASSSAGTSADTPAAAGAGNAGVKPRMLLITGPNASGKSVYMKQVALLVYMAHIGSFIPARSAVIGLTDRILTRLPGMESVAQHTSSFMADLAQVSHLLARATSRSLVLLDEFGKGTASSDGVGLLAALLQHYAQQPSPPLLLACTHFSELLDPGVLPRSPQMALCTMQVLVGGSSGSSAGFGHAGTSTEGGGQQQQEQQQEQQQGVGAGPSWDQEHVFLYKLVPGVVASSYGLHCARLCGVDEAVLTRAADVLALQEAGQPISRLAMPQLEERDRVCWELVHKLAAVDVSDLGAVKQLLTAVIKAEAGTAE